ncbi:MAG: hypothetical protein AB1801_28945, partial [Chloroflexota bacterium]
PTVLKIAQPMVQRYLTGRAAQYAADYLNRRRALRQQPAEEITADLAGAIVPAPKTGYARGDVFWFTLSGVVLGSALGIMLARLVRPEE